MNKIAPITPQAPLAKANAVTKPGPTPVDPKVHKAAQEFEAMFVRQILTAAKVGGGHDKQQGYDGMAVDALASGITKGGGLGLAREVEDALNRAHAAASKQK